MSGGSWDYFHERLFDIAERLREDKSVARRALGRRLALAARALKAIEWNDSGDGDSEEDKLINLALGGYKAGALAVLGEAVASAEAAHGTLRDALAEARKSLGRE